MLGRAAARVGQAQLELCLCVALLRRAPKPSSGIRAIDDDAVTASEHQRQSVLRRGGAGLGKRGEKAERGDVILALVRR
jgi:hypothetical protein